LRLAKFIRDDNFTKKFLFRRCLIKRELTEQQKVANKEFSSQRIFVEHIIRLIKIFRIAQQRFPLNSQIYQQVILTICGLVRLRIGALVLPVSSN
jgi:hypothetical protein